MKQEQIEGSYDPTVGFTVSFSHVADDSGYYECRVKDDEDKFIQFDVTVHENCESNENCSADTSFSTNLSTIDVSTITYPPELLQVEVSEQELLDRLEKSLSGDGKERHNSGVLLKPVVVVCAFFLSFVW